MHAWQHRINIKLIWIILGLIIEMSERQYIMKKEKQIESNSIEKDEM